MLRYDDIESKLEAPPRNRWSSTTRSRPTGRTAGSSSRSARTAASTCRSGAPCNVCDPRGGDAHLLDHHQHEPGRQRPADLRARHPELGRVLVAPRDGRALVHEQRPRPPGRYAARRHAAPRPGAGLPLRLPVLPPGRHPGSRVRYASVQRVPPAGAEARSARRRARDAVLHRRRVPGRVPATRSSLRSTVPGTGRRRRATSATGLPSPPSTATG